MKLDNFRDLLLKKCEDSSLKNLIQFAREDLLTELVFESLEKMADAKHKGDTANVALRNFGSEMDHETHPDMVRDALGHHATRYKAAVAGDRKDLANAHAKQFFNIVNLAQKAQKHSDGKLDVSAVSPHAWERNSKTNQYDADHPMVAAGKRSPGDFVTDTKGWSYSGKDYSFLQDAPHESYVKEIRRHGHNDAYPMQETRINGKHITVDDMDPSELKGYESHEFDHHPIMEHGKQHAGKRSPEDDARYDSETMAYDDSPHMDKYFDRHDAMKEADPEGYAARGSKASDPVHKETGSPLDISRDETVKEPTPKEKAAETVKTKSKPKMSEEDFSSHISNSDIPDDIKASILARLNSGK